MAPPVNRDVLIGAGPLAYIQPVPQGRGTDQPFELTFLSGVRTLRFRLWRVAVDRPARPVFAEFAHILRFSGERPHAVNVVVVSVFSFRIPCAGLQRRVLCCRRFSVYGRNRTR
jgi:hypothetical protein